jgi:hypothetical protein
MESICTTINREAKAPIRLNWRMNTVKSDSPTFTTLTLEAD